MHITNVILTIFISESCFDASGPPIAYGHLLTLAFLMSSQTSGGSGIFNSRSEGSHLCQIHIRYCRTGHWGQGFFFPDVANWRQNKYLRERYHDKESLMEYNYSCGDQELPYGHNKCTKVIFSGEGLLS